MKVVTVMERTVKVQIIKRSFSEVLTFIKK